MYTWNDWLGHQPTNANLVVVKSRQELVTKLSNVPNQKNARFKVMSSGHSTSDVARPVENQWCIQLDRDNWQPDPQGADWYPAKLDFDGVPYWVPACSTIETLNDELAQKGLAFLNLGSYDKQSIYGAVCTGTHGSGMVSGPLADMVLSIDITSVVDDGNGAPVVKSFRIEQTNGVTNAASFRASANGVELINDSALFNSAVVSMGLFGVVTGLVLRVVPSYWLREVRTTYAWSALKALAAAGTFKPETELRTDLVLTSLPVDVDGINEHRVVVTRRTKVEPPPGAPVVSRNDARTKAARIVWDANLFSADRAARVPAKIGSDAPELSNKLTFNELSGDAPWVSRSDKVLYSSIGKYVAAPSAETAIPLEKWPDAIDALIAKLAELHQAGYHTLSPIGIRFTMPSQHLLAQQFGRNTCTFEIPTLVGAHNKNGPADDASAWNDIAHTLSTLEAVLVEQFDGRPHWGQMSWADSAVVRARYGLNWALWKTKRTRLDPFRTFDNSFSQRLAL